MILSKNRSLGHNRCLKVTGSHEISISKITFDQEISLDMGIQQGHFMSKCLKHPIKRHGSRCSETFEQSRTKTIDTEGEAQQAVKGKK